MDLERQFNRFLETATAEEQAVLMQVFEGFEKRKKYQYDYISGMMGLEGGELTSDTLVVEIPIAPLTNNRLGMTHGGVIATLADNAMGYLVNQSLIPKGKISVTTDLSVRYLAPSKGEKLIAKAFIVRKGKTMYVTQCDMYNEKNKHIATSSATFFVLELNNKDMLKHD